jgi:hypothetical protein
MVAPELLSLQVALAHPADQAHAHPQAHGDADANANANAEANAEANPDTHPHARAHPDRNAHSDPASIGAQAGAVGPPRPQRGPVRLAGS